MNGRRSGMTSSILTILSHGWLNVTFCLQACLSSKLTLTPNYSPGHSVPLGEVLGPCDAARGSVGLVALSNELNRSYSQRGPCRPPKSNEAIASRLINIYMLVGAELRPFIEEMVSQIGIPLPSAG